VKTGTIGVKKASRSSAIAGSGGQLVFVGEIDDPHWPADQGHDDGAGYTDRMSPDRPGSGGGPATRWAQEPGAAWPGAEHKPERRRRGLSAPLALPASFGALLVVGAAAAATGGRLSAGWVLVLVAIIVFAGAALAEVGWLTVAGFSRAPYAQLQVTAGSALRAALVVGGAAAAGVASGAVVRRLAGSYTLWIVDVNAGGHPAADEAATSQPAGQPAARRRHRVADLSGGIGARRVIAGVLMVGVLPLLTAALSARDLRLDLGDDLLVYLVAVVAIAVVGGFWPAVLAAVAASLLVNWYFTPPVHTLTIADGKSLLALLLFVTVAVTVSSVVHLAALRARQAARSAEEAQDLLALAQTVLGGDDTPAAVLAHLTDSRGGRAELLENSAGQWLRVAVSDAGDEAGSGGPVARAAARDDLVLEVSGQRRPLSPRLLDGLTAQVAAALDRDRLRTQAAQAEALAEGNRMRTALLAAVSHDLRTPLASIKASVSTLRQTDVEWTEADEAALLATIEQSADRLDALIGNLLDMSRLTTGALQPFLRPTAIDEVAPVALRGLDGGSEMQMTVPEGLPLVLTDPGLLERVLANLFANALAYSPAGRRPRLQAGEADGGVLLEIIDHGRGVPDELKEQMFEPFQRLGRGTDPTGGAGVGLGLAVVKGFLDTMGGSVQAADTPGGGLTMRVRLPSATAPASAASVVAGP
jgi:two-component system, OmpR family, sensor histidine kinase KdpD